MAHQADQVQRSPMAVGAAHGFAINGLTMPGAGGRARRAGLVERVDEVRDALFQDLDIDGLQGTPEGDWVSMAVRSDGSYGVQEGIISSFPVTVSDGRWEIVQGLGIVSRRRSDEVDVEAFSAFILGPEGRKILADFGFKAP